MINDDQSRRVLGWAINIEFTQPIWSQWAIAATEQRDAAAQARADLVRDRDTETWALAAQREMRAAMLSITAAAFAVEGWGFAARTGPATKPTLGESGVLGVISQHLLMPRDERKTLADGLKELFDRRGELAHHKSPQRPGEQHRVLGSTTTESAIFSLEGAVKSCETLRLVVDACLRYPKPTNPPNGEAVEHSRLVLADCRW